MNINQDNINEFLNKYISFVDEISNKYNYDSNIKHLLYIIVPAFVYKYKISNEKVILDCFRNIKIYKSSHKDSIASASFNRILKKDNNGYYTDKYITINDFDNTNMQELIDDIIHEFNHAINSYNNEIFYDDKYVKVRTGLSYALYDKKSLTVIKKSNEIALEELLNTKDTEDIINIINSFGKYKIDNQEFSNMLYAINIEIGSNYYVSNAYYLQKKICDDLINNKTFTPTINNLRFKGLIEDIPYLFDNVMGISGSYKKLNEILQEMHLLILKYNSKKIFKERLLNKIISKKNDVYKIIQEYENKCIYK